MTAADSQFQKKVWKSASHDISNDRFVSETNFPNRNWQGGQDQFWVFLKVLGEIHQPRRRRLPILRRDPKIVKQYSVGVSDRVYPQNRIFARDAVILPLDGFRAASAIDGIP